MCKKKVLLKLILLSKSSFTDKPKRVLRDAILFLKDEGVKKGFKGAK